MCDPPDESSPDSFVHLKSNRHPKHKVRKFDCMFMQWPRSWHLEFGLEVERKQKQLTKYGSKPFQQIPTDKATTSPLTSTAKADWHSNLEYDDMNSITAKMKGPQGLPRTATCRCSIAWWSHRPIQRLVYQHTRSPHLRHLRDHQASALGSTSPGSRPNRHHQNIRTWM